MEVPILKRAQLTLLGLACDVWKLSRLLTSLKPCKENLGKQSPCAVKLTASAMKLAAMSSSLLSLHRASEGDMYPLDVLDYEELETAQNYWSAVLDIADICSLLNPVYMLSYTLKDKGCCHKGGRVSKVRRDYSLVVGKWKVNSNPDAKKRLQSKTVITGAPITPSASDTIYEIVCELEKIFMRILCINHGIPQSFRLLLLSQLFYLSKPGNLDDLENMMLAMPFTSLSSTLDRLSSKYREVRTTRPCSTGTLVSKWNLHVVLLGALQVGTTTTSLVSGTLEAPDFHHLQLRNLHPTLADHRGLGANCEVASAALLNRLARTMVILRATRTQKLTPFWPEDWLEDWTEGETQHLKYGIRKWGKHFLIDYALVSKNDGRRKVRLLHLFEGTLVITRGKDENAKCIDAQVIPVERWKSVLIHRAGFEYKTRGIDSGYKRSMVTLDQDALLLFWDQGSSEEVDLAVVELNFDCQRTLLIWTGFMSMMLSKQYVTRLTPEQWIPTPFERSYFGYVSGLLPLTVAEASQHIFELQQNFQNLAAATRSHPRLFLPETSEDWYF